MIIEMEKRESIVYVKYNDADKKFDYASVSELIDYFMQNQDSLDNIEIICESNVSEYKSLLENVINEIKKADFKEAFALTTE